MDYDKYIRVMIEFIANHLNSIPLTIVPEPPRPLHHLHRAITTIKEEDDVVETKIIGDIIVPIYKSTFLKAIGVKENPIGFTVQERTAEEFQLFLNHIGYNQG